MSRFIWLVRRELWEHKAIWIAPAIVIACLFLILMIGKAEFGDIEAARQVGEIPQDSMVRLYQLAYGVVAGCLFLVMGVICFFYAIDTLYADRRDRSVLFWKSLPLSDAETVMSKFAVAAIVIPAVALLGAALAQIVVGGGMTAKLAFLGQSVGLWLNPDALLGGATIALFWCVTAMLWYAPVVAYLMLASAWAPRGPFLWAVLPPVAAWILERIALPSQVIGEFIGLRLFGMYGVLIPHSSDEAERAEDGLKALVEKIAAIDPIGRLRDFYSSPDLWLGILAAGLLLAAAMWVRRYRDETT